jgi:hypothetical protein
MLKPSDGSAEKKALREKIMGLGDSSLKKKLLPAAAGSGRQP